jgi:hypothetical protein
MKKTTGLVVLLAALVAACGGDRAETSAGAALVESDAPLWDAGGSWRLADSPALSIGVEAGDEPYMFYRVRSVLRLDDGRIFASDSGAYEIRIFDSAGAFINKVGRRGQGPGEYSEFTSMRLFGPTPSAHILVSDSMNRRLNVLDLDGGYVTQVEIGPAPNAARGSVVGLFRDGSWAVTAVDGDSALRGDPGTILQARYQWRRYSDEGQAMELLTYTDARPRIVNQVGGITNFPFIPFSADGQAIPVGDKLWVTTAADPEMWAVDFDGNEVRRVRWRLPDRPRSADVYGRYAEESLAGIDDETDLMQYRHLYQQELPIPEYIPSHREMIADELGNLWLERYRLPWESQPRWDVVDPELGWLGVVETPLRFQVTQITAEAVIGVHRDEEGVTRVQVFALLK